MSRWSDRRVTWALLAVYAATLLGVLGLTPLWLDEIQQFGNTRHSTISELLTWVRVDVGASPLPYLIQRGVVSVLGYSAYAARLPAAICSILSGIVFAILVPRFVERGRVAAVVLFLTLPLQFRYGLEARVYSQGLLLSLLALWVFLVLRDHPAPATALLYWAIATAGMYSQPLVCFPLLGQALYAAASPDQRTRVYVWTATAAAVAAFLPWYFAKQATQGLLLSKPIYFFSFRQVMPQVLLHDLTGGGYATTAALLVLVFWPARRSEVWKESKRLLLCILAASLIGPVVMDALVPYYFADRQLLFAMPALVLLAARGFEGLLDQRAWAAWALVTVFVAASVFKDFRLATVPRDDLDLTAAAVAARLDPGACLLAAPPEQAAYYVFLRPELEHRVCGKDLSSAAEILAVTGPYSGENPRRALSQSIPQGFAAGAPIGVGESELTVYRRR